MKVGKQDQKEHRAKKNPRSAEAFAEARKARNATRPKQVWSITAQAWIRQ